MKCVLANDSAAFNLAREVSLVPGRMSPRRKPPPPPRQTGRRGGGEALAVTLISVEEPSSLESVIHGHSV